MRPLFLFLLLPLFALGLSAFGKPINQPTYTRHVWYVKSPVHGQTFAYGSQQHQVWVTIPNHKKPYLALSTTYTNDPYVDRSNPRQYDYFTFDFPNVPLGADGKTFSYRTADGRTLPVATIKSDFFGIKEIHLTPNSHLDIKKVRGYLTVTIIVEDHGPIDGMP